MEATTASTFCCGILGPERTTFSYEKLYFFTPERFKWKCDSPNNHPTFHIAREALVSRDTVNRSTGTRTYALARAETFSNLRNIVDSQALHAADTSWLAKYES